MNATTISIAPATTSSDAVVTAPASVCPNCGYCPHCGRAAQPVYPAVQPIPYPVYPTGPIWIAPVWTAPSTGPVTVTCGIPSN